MQAEVEHSRDVLVRLAFRQQLQHLPLAGSKQLIAVVHLALPQLPHVILHQHLADRRTEKRLPCIHSKDGADQIRFRRVLEQVPTAGGVGLKGFSRGSVIARSVPRPTAESMRKVPPRLLTRSCIPTRPRPFSTSGWNPRPSSWIRT